jgi:predicted outer membrane repeat protein
VINICNGTYFKKNILILFSVCLIAIIAISSINAVNAAGKTINPNTSGGLKEAIATAKNGDVIYLENGVYTGENNTCITINKNITIKGLGANVILDDKRKNQIFQINKVKVSLKNLKFKGSDNIKDDDDSGGGLIYIVKGSLTLSSCTFTNVKSPYRGVVYSESSNLLISSCIFSNNWNKVIEISNSKCRVSKCTFKYNEAEAIDSWKSNLTGFKSNFTNNSNGAIGSAYGSLTVSSCIFKNNKGEYGAAIESETSILTVNSCIFKNNKVTLYGGAIDSMDSSLTVNRCTFTNNQAKCDGGAIRSYFRTDFNSKIAKCSVSSSTFTNNKANKQGGAISNSNMPIKVANSKFKKNISAKVYNAIYSYRGKLTKKNVVISPKDGIKV